MHMQVKRVSGGWIGKVLVLLLVAVVLIVVGLGAWYASSPSLQKQVEREGVLGAVRQMVSEADDWVAREVLDVAHTYIVPTIEFETFTWEPPYGLTMVNVTMTAPDGTQVVTAEELGVTLAERPKRGEPIRIEAIRLVRPELQLIRTEATAEGGASGFKGLVPFVENTEPEAREELPEERRLSEVLELRELKLVEGSVVYDDGQGSPMRIRGIDLDTQITPRQTEDGRTLHELSIAFGTEPVLSVTADGAVDLDALVAEIEKLELSADLASERAVASLPPQVQRAIEQYEAKGRLDVRFSGTVNARDALAQSSGRLDMVLAEGRVASETLVLPVPRAEVGVDLARGGIATLTPVRIETLGGIVELQNAVVRLMETGMPMDAAWSIREVHLERATKVSQPPSPEDLKETELKGQGMRGRVASSGQMQMRLAEAPGSISGSGTLNVTEGKLVSIPVLGDLLSLADLLTGGGGDPKDTVDAAFDLTGTGVDLSELKIEVDVAKLAGKGTIGYDGALDITMRGGAVEKMPVIGGALGAITGRLVRYVIRGTAGDPDISIKPL